MKNFRLIYFFVAFVFLISCISETPTIMEDPKDYVLGKNAFTLTVDGIEREYFVHVPSGFDKNIPAPVVFMLHGTSGNGEKFYNISGWKEVGERENILTVYPSSWRHCVIKDGQRQNTTKWHVYPSRFEYCEGETPLDDVAFLRGVIDSMIQRFHIDEKRIYMVGFSNGGEMVSRCAVELSDRLAAVVMASGVNLEGNLHTPKRLLPVTVQVGTIENFDTPLNIKDFEKLITSPSDVHIDELLKSVRSTFLFKEGYKISGHPDTLQIASFPAQSGNKKRELRFMMINNMPHMYPNGIKHPFKAAEEHWSWLKQYTLP